MTICNRRGWMKIEILRAKEREIKSDLCSSWMVLWPNSADGSDFGQIVERTPSMSSIRVACFSLPSVSTAKQLLPKTVHQPPVHPPYFLLSTPVQLKRILSDCQQYSITIQEYRVYCSPDHCPVFYRGLYNDPFINTAALRRGLYTVGFLKS